MTKEEAIMSGTPMPSVAEGLGHHFSLSPGLLVSLSHQAAAVCCRGVTKEFGSGDTRVQALRGVDLDIPPGEMALLVGPSGCGKTTLISIIAGLLDPTGGAVSVLGADLARLRGRALVNFRGRNIGFVFQQYNLLPALTAAENAAVPLVIAGVARRRAIARATRLLEALGLGDRAQAFPAQLSGGQQQRVAIARALVHEPRLLVCDEPTAALDAQAGHTVMELLRRVAVQPGRAVIVVTHDNRVFEFGDRIIAMNDGRIEGVQLNSISNPAERGEP
jgi:putative ABC transport system ATP-binding protein